MRDGCEEDLLSRTMSTKRFYIELPDEEVPGVHRKADQDVAQNKVSSVSVTGRL